VCLFHTEVNMTKAFRAFPILALISTFVLHVLLTLPSLCTSSLACHPTWTHWLLKGLIVLTLTSSLVGLSTSCNIYVFFLMWVHVWVRKPIFSAYSRSSCLFVMGSLYLSWYIQGSLHCYSQNTRDTCYYCNRIIFNIKLLSKSITCPCCLFVPVCVCC